jgi:hypothetical protein
MIGGAARQGAVGYSPEKLEGYAQVVPEVKVVQHLDHMLLRVGFFLLAQVIQYLHLHEGLVMKPLLVPIERRNFNFTILCLIRLCNIVSPKCRGFTCHAANCQDQSELLIFPFFF